MNQKRWVLLLKKDDTVDVYYITTSGKYQKRGTLTHDYVCSPEQLAEIVDDQSIVNVWVRAVTILLHKVLVKQQTENGVVYGIIDEHGEFFVPDMVTIVYMVKILIDQAFSVLIEEQAIVA